MSLYLSVETLSVWQTFPLTAVVCGVPETSQVSERLEAVVVAADQGAGTVLVSLTVASTLPAQPQYSHYNKVSIRSGLKPRWLGI